MAQHRHALEEQGVEEALRLSLEAAMRIDAPIDSVRTQALSELAESSLSAACESVLQQIVQIAGSLEPGDDRDSILLTQCQMLGQSGCLEDLFRTLKLMTSDAARAKVLASAIRLWFNSEGMGDWLREKLLPELDELVPAVAPRAELVAIIGAALSAKPHDLPSCLGNTLSYSDASWAWLSTSAVPQIEKIRSRRLFLVIHRDAWEHPLRVSIP